jgi:hypothetical protein
MTAMTKFRRTAMAALVIAAEAACLGLALDLVAVAPAGAQFFFDDRYPFLDPRSRRRGGFFDPDYQEERPTDFSRAPAPAVRKPDAPPVTTKILVLGDSMADWLAYGLEDALGETPEVGIVRKHRAFSGLIRYEAKPDAPDWSQVARDLIAAEKPHAVIMMIGVQDRQAIREKQPPKEQKPAQKPEANKPAQPQDDEQPNIIAPEQTRPRIAGVHEYHTEKWEELYNKKIEDTIAALKSANVPVLWIGLPSIRGAKSTADALYLNEFYRARAEAAGILYVDIWDGFVDEQGRFSTRGPDLEGQMRPLRTGDGVHFTKFGARKLAHYVERELRRVLTAIPVALTTPPEQTPAPSQPAPAAARPAAPAQRPLAGPVFLLTTNTEESDELLGGGPSRQPAIDPVAANVLVKGTAVAAAAGRADDFSWPPRVPNIKFSEPLPPSGPPVMMSRSSRQTAQAQPGIPGQARVAGQSVLQGQIAPQNAPRVWRAPPPAYYGPPRGFFGLFR